MQCSDISDDKLQLHVQGFLKIVVRSIQKINIIRVFSLCLILNECFKITIFGQDWARLSRIIFRNSTVSKLIMICRQEKHDIFVNRDIK